MLSIIGTKLFGVFLAISLIGPAVVWLAKSVDRMWDEKPPEWKAVQNTVGQDLTANIGGRVNCSSGALIHWQRSDDKWWFAGHRPFAEYLSLIDDMRASGQNPKNPSWSVEISQDERDWIAAVEPAPEWWNLAKKQRSPVSVLIKQGGQIKYVIQGGRDNVIYLSGVTATPH